MKSGSKKKLHDNSFMYPESLWPFTSGWKSGDTGKFLLRIENAVLDMQFNYTSLLVFYLCSTCYIVLLVKKNNKNQSHNRVLKGCLFVKLAQ